MIYVKSVLFAHQSWKSVIYLFILVCIATIACKKASKDIATKHLQSEKKQSIWEKTDTTCLLAWQILDLENQASPVSNATYALIDELLTTCTPLTTAKKLVPQYILHNIHDCLQTQNYELSSYHNGLGVSLNYHKYDCDILCFLYLTIAEHHQLPIYALYSPKHLSLVWQDEQDTIYWEATTGKASSLQYYLNKKELNPDEVGEGLLLRPLNRRELTAIVHYNNAQTYVERGKYSKALPLLYQSIQMAPNWCESYLLLGNIFEQLEDYDKAEIAYEQAYQNLPSYQLTKDKLSSLYTKIGCLEEAEALMVKK